MAKTTFLAALAGAVLLSGAALFSGHAQAADKDAPIILIVNQQQLLTQSDAGKSVAEQLKSLGAQVNAELATESQEINTEGKNLQEQQKLLSKEVLEQRAQALYKRQQQFEGMKQVREKEMQIAEQRALGKIGDAMSPILEDIVKKRGATLLLDRSAVMYAAADTDVTQEVLNELNKKLKTVKVERVDLKTEIAKIQAQQQAAANGKKKK